MSEEDRVVLSFYQAVAMLPDKQEIHTFRLSRVALIGADWDRSEIISAIKKYGVELSGPNASGMGHGMVLTDSNGFLFIETRKID